MPAKYEQQTSKSKEFHYRARKVLPAGVSYFIRFFEPYPFYVNWAQGSKLKDVDGNEYTDFWMGHYTHILGHSPQNVIAAVSEQIQHGTHYGVSHELEVMLAEKIVTMVPCADMVRFCNSGTESSMYAVRLARSFTGKNGIVKFEGGWHGGYDPLHKAVKPPFEMSASSGLVDEALKDTIIVPYNDLNGVIRKTDDHEIAAILIEPVLGAGGCIPANREFLKGLREFCDDRQILLIFDEIITGFRLAPGGGQEYYGVIPDIAIFGKILGGGFPIGAVTGKREIMERMDPMLFERPSFSFQGGTFTGNPTSLVAGLEVLKSLEDGQIIHDLNRRGERLRKDLQEVFSSSTIDVNVTNAGSLFCTHFTAEPVNDVHAVFRADRRRLLDYHLKLIEKGIFFLPTHSGALSTVHSEEELQHLLVESEKYVKSLKS
ncbi:MAG: aspartate aminotransferase family protein [Candidatus Bathyarchaeota archaeon]|nr:MAG: aspartate aminotransferase family protein [Candidatus Bathyarchaeota archaeon]